MSPYPVPWIIGKPTAQMTAEADSSSVKMTAKEREEWGAGRVGRTGWVADIRRMLRFNAPFQEGRREDDPEPVR